MKSGSARRKPAVPQDSVIYAVGDIHGEAGRLDALHGAIRADALGRDASRRVVVYLGDYIDRGPDSAGVIERLAAGPLPEFESVFLMGNHEELLLRFLADPAIGPAWFFNGGDATIASYGIGRNEAPGYAEARDCLASRLPDAHRRFLDSLTLHHIEGDYLFVHAGLRPGRSLEKQSRSDLLWIRHEFLDSQTDFGFVVVHGHTPVREPQVRLNRIGIDTGAVYGGRLTALVLEGTGQAFLQS